MKKIKTQYLTDVGIDKIEKLSIQKKLLKNNNFYDPENLSLSTSCKSSVES